MRMENKIQRDLLDIRYYYGQKKQIDEAMKSGVDNQIRELVEKYTAAIKNAPVRLFHLYVSLYVNNNTQEVVAGDWNCSKEYIKQQNKKLCDYLRDDLDGA